MMPHQLDTDGKALLHLLANRLSTANPGDPKEFITYSEALKNLRIDDDYRNPGRTLQQRGLNTLAGWTKESGVPAITGFIVREFDRNPGQGYFTLYGKQYPDDIPWWMEEIKKSKQFDWSRYL